MAKATPYDAIVLDVMLPGLDGFETCRELRAGDVWAPVLILTARDDVEDRVARPRQRRRRLPREAVLVRGAARPAARDRAPRARRAAGGAPGRRSRGSTRRRTVRGAATSSSTSRRRSSRCSSCSCAAPGETLTRGQLLDGAWDIAFEGRSNVVDVYVRYLREKIDRPFGRDSIETVRGVGYRLRSDDV